MTHIPGNTEQLAEEKLLSDFYRSQGVRNLTAGGLFWYSAGLRLFTPIPCNRHISLSSQDLSSMWSQGALFALFPSADKKPFFPGHFYVVEDNNYGLETIKGAKDRYYIRRALKQCKVENIPFELLLQKGSPLVEDTYGRQGRNCGKSVLEICRNYFRAAASNPLFSAWGAFVSNELAAFKVEFTFRGGVHADTVFSRNDLLKYYPVNALVFVSTQQAMKRAGISYVFYGERPVTGEREGLMRFKESMGYKKVPLKQRLEVNPIVRPAFSRPLSSATKAVADLFYHRSGYARIVSGVISTLRGQIEHSDAGYGG
jgi:hypothetical protein